MLIAPKFSSRCRRSSASRRARLERQTLRRRSIDVDQVGERSVQLLLAILGDILELGYGLGLPYLDLGPVVACLGRSAVKVGKLVAHVVGELAGGGKRRNRVGQFSILACDLIAGRRDAVGDLVDGGVQSL